MRVLCIGGGPAGLYFGLLMKLQNPSHEVIVVERNRPYDTFGWGVVFSDATLENLKQADPVSAAEINAAFNHWDDIDIHIGGRTIRSGGHGFIGIGRKRLLNILQARCEALGVKLVFETDVSDDQALARQYNADLVIASTASTAASAHAMPRASSPISTRASAALSGSARTSCSTPSRSHSRRPSMAGSRRTPIASTTTRRRSSLRRLSRSGGRRH
jgi:hypothetical protein